MEFYFICQFINWFHLIEMVYVVFFLVICYYFVILRICWNWERDRDGRSFKHAEHLMTFTLHVRICCNFFCWLFGLYEEQSFRITQSQFDNNKILFLVPFIRFIITIIIYYCSLFGKNGYVFILCLYHSYHYEIFPYTHTYTHSTVSFHFIKN